MLPVRPMLFPVSKDHSRKNSAVVLLANMGKQSCSWEETLRFRAGGAPPGLDALEEYRPILLATLAKRVMFSRLGACKLRLFPAAEEGRVELGSPRVTALPWLTLLSVSETSRRSFYGL